MPLRTIQLETPHVVPELSDHLPICVELVAANVENVAFVPDRALANDLYRDLLSSGDAAPQAHLRRLM